MNRVHAAFDRIVHEPRYRMPMAMAGGALKGAIVGLAIGKLAVATAAGVAGGAAVGAVLSWQARRRQTDAPAPADRPKQELLP